MHSELEIVVIEDDPVAQQAYADSLANLRCNLSFCNTVSLALSLCNLVTPDLVIVDLGLPDGTGSEAIEEIVTHFSDNPPYIFVVTSSADKDEHELAMRAGANELMIKPVAGPELIKRIKTSSIGKIPR